MYNYEVLCSYTRVLRVIIYISTINQYPLQQKFNIYPESYL